MGVRTIKNIIIKICEELLRIKAKAPKTVNIRIHSGVNDTKFDGCNVVDRGTNVQHSHIGFATVIGPNCKVAYTDIGKYCSIAPNVKVIVGTHPSKKFVSTCPVFYSTRQGRGFSYVEKQKFEEFQFLDSKNRISVIIGNDVWIGANVTILQGVKIGDGAIIAAGAVVIHDVEPYTIVGGVPAKKIRDRFTDEQKEVLQNVQWWNRDQKWLKKNAEYFSDIDNFVGWIGKEEEKK